MLDGQPTQHAERYVKCCGTQAAGCKWRWCRGLWVGVLILIVMLSGYIYRMYVTYPKYRAFGNVMTAECENS